MVTVSYMQKYLNTVNKTSVYLIMNIFFSKTMSVNSINTLQQDTLLRDVMNMLIESYLYNMHYIPIYKELI